MPVRISDKSQMSMRGSSRRHQKRNRREPENPWAGGALHNIGGSGAAIRHDKPGVKDQEDGFHPGVHRDNKKTLKTRASVFFLWS
jgi:hypothetical protein